MRHDMYSEEEVEKLVDDIKQFRVGCLAKPFEAYINKCVVELKTKHIEQERDKKWWQIW